MVRTADSPVASDKLLLGLAEQLKLPLLQIARRAELQAFGQPVDAAAIQATAESALRLIDSYTLGIRLIEDGQSALVLEPVSIASTLYDTAHQLSAVAAFYGVNLELSIEGKYGPVQAHAQGLQSAMVSLGSALIEALPTLDSKQLTLQLGAHRSRYGIVAGIYSDAPNITPATLRRGLRLAGQSRQPFVDMSHSAAAGIFVADSILQAMASRLQVSRHHGLQGMGAVLKPNHQLQFV